jgi:inner membrane protein
MLSSLPLQPGLLAGLLIFGLVVTLSTRWLVAWFRGRTRFSLSPGDVLADLLWALIVTLTGLVSARYTERADHPLAYWLAYGAGVVVLSLLRAYLYDRYRKAKPQRAGLSRRLMVLDRSAWQLGYLLVSAILFLGLATLAGWYVDLLLFIPLAAGALLPGLDAHGSWISTLLPSVSRRIWARFGREHILHSVGALLLAAVLCIPVGLVAGWAFWGAFLLGYASHLFLDLLRPLGVPLLWPAIHERFAIRHRWHVAPDSFLEQVLMSGLIIAVIALLLLVELGQPPPPPAPELSYDQALERYYSLRGRNQVVAAVEGTWQAAGRRIAARFEVLNARGESLVMLDRFTGKVFTAGQGPEDDLYLNRIRLQPGSPVRVQAVEVQLRDELLASALPAIYQMEREPGLQHIFVSGDLFLSEDGSTAGAPLEPSYAQTGLRRVQPGDGGPRHFQLRYLTASELIELAGVGVDSADLIITATYVPDEAGPTPTPLPTPRLAEPGVETKP